MKKSLLSRSSVQEGIFFLLLGGMILAYSLDARSKSFNQDWTQSPYLFPVFVAVIMAGLALTILYQGIRGEEAAKAGAPKHTGQVLIILGITLAYYVSLAVLKIPYITFGILSWSLTISNFEIMTVLFLVVMMLYLGVRNIPVLVFVPLGISLFLSITFRAMLHVLLP